MWSTRERESKWRRFELYFSFKIIYFKLNLCIFFRWKKCKMTPLKSFSPFHRDVYLKIWNYFGGLNMFSLIKSIKSISYWVEIPRTLNRLSFPQEYAFSVFRAKNEHLSKWMVSLVARIKRETKVLPHTFQQKMKYWHRIKFHRLTNIRIRFCFYFCRRLCCENGATINFVRKSK